MWISSSLGFWGTATKRATFRTTRLGESFELNLALLEIYIESSMREGCLAVCGAYLHAECCDLQYALDSEHPREGHVHVLQRVLVRIALPMILQCIHWQTHGRTNRHTYVRKSLNRVSRIDETIFFLFSSLSFSTLFRPQPIVGEEGRSGSFSFFFFFKIFCAPIHEHSVLHNIYYKTGIIPPAGLNIVLKTK